MQRQAVPLLQTEPPIVATGMEKTVAKNSGMAVRAKTDGFVTKVAADEIEIDYHDTYSLRKYTALNERTCLNQKPIVSRGQRVAAGQVIADGAAIHQGELSLGRNVLVAFMTWEGGNFEDAIIVSDRLVKDGRYTSIHVEEFEVEIRETKLGREEFTRDIPNVGERALGHLDEDGIIMVGTQVGPDDILVGKVAPKSKSELTPEEKLLQAIFGRAAEGVRDESLSVPSGIEGIVIDTEHITRKSVLAGEERHRVRELTEKVERQHSRAVADCFRSMAHALRHVAGGRLSSKSTGEPITYDEMTSVGDVLQCAAGFDVEDLAAETPEQAQRFAAIYARYLHNVQELEDEKGRRLDRMRRGDELPAGVLEMVRIIIATKRMIAIGDKFAGRHGNKGVIAKILPEEDMPFLEDGTPVEMILNPLGVPSRMNVGQILETHLGWAAKALGYRAITPIFSGATEAEIRQCLGEAGLPENGKAALRDGRTGEPFDQTVTVGYIYMMKLHHLVDDKVHARATGPYSLVTQQPLGGKARAGGQRFGEMEVWAIEAYGAAHILQELLTVKSDDVEGRSRMFESMVKGHNVLQASTPVSFDVLVNEMRGLCLKVEVGKAGAWETPGLSTE